MFFYSEAAPDPTRTMRAAVYDHAGPAETVLRIDPAHARPAVHAQHLLVRVVSSGLNPLDIKFRKHPTPHIILPRPKIPGIDVAGVVSEVGQGCTAGFKQGDIVFAMGPQFHTHWGSCAEYWSIPEVLVAHAPTTVPLWQTASLPLVALTVIQGLRPVLRAWGVKGSKAKHILIHGGTGGVGSFAIGYVQGRIKKDGWREVTNGPLFSKHISCHSLPLAARQHLLLAFFFLSSFLSLPSFFS